MRLIVIAAVGFALICMLCVPGAFAANAKWTLMFYIDGDNNLESQALVDINEIEEIGSTAQVNALVQVDRTPRYVEFEGNWTDTRRGRITHDTNPNALSSALTSIGEKNMGDPSTLTEFIQWGATNYPADHYVVVLWNHGDGWRQATDSRSADSLDAAAKESSIPEVFRAVCFDETSGDDALFTSEVRSAIENSGVHLDIIGFDACLMQMIEVAYELRSVADYMVASEELEWGDGWELNLIMGELTANPDMPAAGLASLIVDKYAEAYGDQLTLSALDLGQLGELATRVSVFASLAAGLASEWDALDLARAHSTSFGVPYEQDYRDLFGFMSDVPRWSDNASLSAAAQSVVDWQSHVVLRNHTGTAEHAGGISIYITEIGRQPSAQYSALNLRFAADTQWDQFLNVFANGIRSDDQYEENDTFAQAKSIAVGEYLGLMRLDNDYFKIDVPANERLIVSIAFPGTEGALNLTLYNSAQQLVASSTDDWANFQAVYTKAATDTSYYIAVTGTDLTCYDMWIKFVSTDSIYTATTETYSWDAASGPTLVMGDDDFSSIPIGFDFVFYGTPFNSINVSANGYLTFGYSGSEWFNQPLPIILEPNNIIAPFWDDLCPGAGTTLTYALVGQAPNRRLVVQWNNILAYTPSGEPKTGAVSFQTILFEGTNEILFNYQDTAFDDVRFNAGTSATVGIEDNSGDKGILWSYNEAVIQSLSSIRFIPDQDEDGLTDRDEFTTYGTDPYDADTDNDGAQDGFEIAHDTDPLDPNSVDRDGDGIFDQDESVYGTSPINADSDDDGLTDGEEVFTYNTNPLEPDSDDDGFYDGFEVDKGSDPLNPDSQPPLELQIVTGSLPLGTAGVYYSSSITVDGGLPPYYLSLMHGTLPQGLTFDAGGFTIHGTPQNAGTWNFILEVTDSQRVPQTAYKQLALQIDETQDNDGNNDGNNNDGNNSGGCAVGMIVGDTPLARDLWVLRSFRDQLLHTTAGASFSALYYRLSLPLTRAILSHSALLPSVRAGVLLFLFTITVASVYCLRLLLRRVRPRKSAKVAGPV